jgi:hypothetical protein
MNRGAILLCSALMLFLPRSGFSQDGDVSAWDDNFHYGATTHVDGWATDGDLDWCSADEGCGWAASTHVTVWATDSFYQYCSTHSTYAECMGLDDWPGQNMQPATYYEEGDTEYETWYWDPDTGEDWGGDNWSEDDGYHEYSISPGQYAPTITGPNNVWCFWGYSPAGYDTTITLRSDAGPCA